MPRGSFIQSCRAPLMDARDVRSDAMLAQVRDEGLGAVILVHTEGEGPNPLAALQ